MIRVNLLPQKRAKRIAASNEPRGGRELTLGLGALAVVGLLVYVAVDRPKRSELGDLDAANDQLAQDIAGKNKLLAGYAALKKDADLARARDRAINRLLATKIVPANVLHELGEILTPNHLPTMTDAMKRRTGNGTGSDPNRRLDLAWDPTHVWLLSFTDTGNAFKLEGGAEAENDIIQLSKRLEASAYFEDVSQSTEQRVADKTTGLAYYNFTITGKVAY